MPFQIRALSRYATSSRRPRERSHAYVYTTEDTAADVQAAGYFNGALERFRLRAGDVIDVAAGVLGTPSQLRVAVVSIVAGVVSTADVGGLLLPRNAVIAAIGDSTTAGQSAGVGAQQAVKSWPEQTADLLNAAGIAAASDHLFGDRGCWGQSVSLANFLTGENRLAVTGGGALSTQQGAGGYVVRLGAGDTLTWTPRQANTKALIGWRDGTSGVFDISIGGGPAVRVTGTNSVGTALLSQLVTAAARGTNAITITGVSGTTVITSIRPFDDSLPAQAQVLNLGISGAGYGSLNDTSMTPRSRLQQYGDLNADLYLVGGMVNDPRLNVAVATAKDRLTTLVQQCKAAKGGTAKVMLLTPLHDPSTTGNAANQEQYVQAMREVAAEQGVLLLDIRAKWQSHAYAVSQGWTPNGDVHPTTAGYAMIAGWVRDAIRFAA